MKDYYTNVFTTILFLFILTLPVLGQVKAKTCTSGRLEATTTQTNYLLLEPVSADIVIATENKFSLEHVNIRVKDSGGIKTYSQLSHFRTRKFPVFLPKSKLRLPIFDRNPVSKTAKIIRNTVVLERTAEFFPRVGSYELQFFIPNH